MERTVFETELKLLIGKEDELKAQLDNIKSQKSQLKSRLCDEFMEAHGIAKGDYVRIKWKDTYGREYTVEGFYDGADVYGFFGLMHGRDIHPKLLKKKKDGTPSQVAFSTYSVPCVFDILEAVKVDK